MTYVTCPALRYHPAIVAQKAATIQICRATDFAADSEPGRTSTSTWSGTAGRAVGARHEMLSEAVDIIAALFDDEQAGRSTPTCPIVRA